MVLAVGISLLSSIRAEIYGIAYVLPVMAALTPVSESVHTSPIELLDPETVGVAIGISLLSSIDSEIFHYFNVLPVMAAIFDLTPTPMSDSVDTCPTEFCWTPKM